MYLVSFFSFLPKSIGRKSCGLTSPFQARCSLVLAVSKHIKRYCKLSTNLLCFLICFSFCHFLWEVIAPVRTSQNKPLWVEPSFPIYWSIRTIGLPSSAGGNFLTILNSNFPSNRVYEIWKFKIRIFFFFFCNEKIFYGCLWFG